MTKYGRSADMTPPPLVKCSSPDCQWSTPEGLPDFSQITEHLKIHASLAHPVAAAAANPQDGTGAPTQAAKLDKKVRPSARLGMSELQWRFYISEWNRYTRQTGITGQSLRDELWNTMETELRQLAFLEGGGG